MKNIEKIRRVKMVDSANYFWTIQSKNRETCDCVCVRVYKLWAIYIKFWFFPLVYDNPKRLFICNAQLIYRNIRNGELTVSLEHVGEHFDNTNFIQEFVRIEIFDDGIF